MLGRIHRAAGKPCQALVKLLRVPLSVSCHRRSLIPTYMLQNSNACICCWILFRGLTGAWASVEFSLLSSHARCVALMKRVKSHLLLRKLCRMWQQSATRSNAFNLLQHDLQIWSLNSTLGDWAVFHAHACVGTLPEFVTCHSGTLRLIKFVSSFLCHIIMPCHRLAVTLT